MISSHNIHELEQLCNKVLYLQQGQLSSQSNSNTDADQQYLTLQLEQDHSETLLTALNLLPGVVSLRALQKKELLLCYNPVQNASFDLALLQCLAANGWGYRNLIKGQTLEQKLFSV